MATESMTSTATGRVYKNLVGGDWLESRTGETFENVNPADTRDLIGIFQKSGAEDVELAVEAARQAFKKWRLVPAPRRAEILYAASQLLAERKEQFARDMTREMGKVLKRPAAMCRKPSTPATTWPARAAACSAPPRPPSCPTSSPWRCAARRGLRHDHALELPHGHSLLEALSGPGRGKSASSSRPRTRRFPPLTSCRP